MNFLAFQAMLQDNGLKLAFTPARAEHAGLRGDTNPERILFEKMMRAHADNLGRLARNMVIGSMGGDEEISVASAGPWAFSRDVEGCYTIQDLSGADIGGADGLGDYAQAHANALLMAKAFELRGKLRRLAVASQVVLSASSGLIETQVAARDALFVATKDAIKTLEEVYPDRASIEHRLAETPPQEVGE